MEKKFRQQPWIFKDRSLVDSAMFKIPISYAIFGSAIIMLILFVTAWSIEGKILKEVIGFELPLVIKIFSLLSTLSLFTFLLNSTGVIYFVVVSSLMYFISHSLLLSGLLEFFSKFREYDRPLMNMMYYKPSGMKFYLVLGICSLRILMGIPFSYYSLVLFTMRRVGGNGWKRIPALKLEKDTLVKEIKKLEERQVYVEKKNRIFEL